MINGEPSAVGLSAYVEEAKSKPSVLSLLVPGLGQMYAGRSDRGAAILVAGIIIGTLALIWQTLHAPYASNLVAYPYPFYRITLVVYAAVFWIWQIIDAYRLTK